jgi:4-hydroxybenzoate polyprenyltransferase
MNQRPEAQTLIVDLDAALLGGEPAAERVWAAAATDWHALPGLLAGIGGRARRAAPVPARVEALDRVRAWRAGGRPAVLMAGADPAFAERAAAELGLFDRVIGPRPADQLAAEFGPGGFVYLGAPAATGGRLGPALRALRPHQWAKNLLVFLPMLAAHRLDGAALWQSVIAFLAFSAVASGVYVLNDLLDLAADRAHPRKRRRPFAAGSLPLAWGGWLAIALPLLGLGLGLLAGGLFVAVLGGYYLLTLAYSMTLKRRLVIDIISLAGLYTIRIVGGGAATQIPLSIWLLAFSTFFFFSLAAVKRQGELVDQVAAGRTGVAGRGYTTGDLPVVTGMALASGYVAILVMALFINATTTAGLYATPEVLWGICPVLFYWISRIVMITHRGWMHDDPVVFAFRDNISRICFLLVLLAAAVATVFSL